jgi:ubiquinone/menaquinone biosynthesis C-methylase UbiE
MEGDAEALTLKDESVDGYTIAFGIRNVTHIDRALKEAYRYVLYLYETTVFDYFYLIL